MSAQPAPMTFSLETQIAEVGARDSESGAMLIRPARRENDRRPNGYTRSMCMLAVRGEPGRGATRGSPATIRSRTAAALARRPAPAPRLPLEPAERNAFGHSCAVCAAPGPPRSATAFRKVTEVSTVAIIGPEA